jgi:signal peptidase I
LIVPGYAPGDTFWKQIGDRDDEICICMACRKTSKMNPGKAPMQGPDRILVNQLIKPQRWDIMVFRFPREPEQKWVFRLVGLPGETVYIKDGAVWVNDARMEPPPELAGVKYTPVVGEFMTNLGTEDNPFRLGPKECCVLGDFPERCSDSRDWGPVPVENIEGVACAIYWPPARWRVLR